MNVRGIQASETAGIRYFKITDYPPAEKANALSAPVCEEFA